MTEPLPDRCDHGVSLKNHCSACAQTVNEPERDYPSEAQLRNIREWTTPDWENLLEYVKDCFSTYGRAERKRDGTWEFATGGWSGNEEIIDALSDNGLAWAMLWRSSHRGGLYIFRTPEAESRRAVHVGKARKGR